MARGREDSGFRNEVPGAVLGFSVRDDSPAQGRCNRINCRQQSPGRWRALRVNGFSLQPTVCYDVDGMHRYLVVQNNLEIGYVSLT
jgi:hypothetical protein